jgi:hypothetical protein
MASERRKRSLYLLALAAILLLSTLLRFYRLDASSLWSDEGNTWAMLGRGYGEIAQAAAADIHPPGYYWLLKLWSGVFGSSAWAMRSFAAVAGVLLVLVVERIARLIAPPSGSAFWLPLLAALLAALNPLLIYYSQEARMYMLLALGGAGLFWSMLAGPLWQMHAPPLGNAVAQGKQSGDRPSEWRRWWPFGYVIFGVLGIWTHYSFPIVLAATNAAYSLRWLSLRRTRASVATGRNLAQWMGLNLLVVLAFAPWLPTAVERVLNWPKGGVAIGLLNGLETVGRVLLFGPLRTLPEQLWPWLVVSGLLPVLGLLALALGNSAGARRFALPLALWLGLPIALMTLLGLFTDAFLKFLIVASPAWCVLSACAPLLAANRTLRAVLAGLIAVGAVTAALLVLPAYYQDPNARDNYAGVAAYIRATADPQRDLVVLDAPGQGEVWRYYDPGVPVLPLPQTRPPAAAEVEAALAEAAEGRRQVYALFWAADEADPRRLVEGWLDRNAFKALDVWQGNLRLATYALAADVQPLPFEPLQLGEAMLLKGQAQPGSPQEVAAGEAALVQLQWQALQDLRTRYKVSVQLLDGANQVVAQRDSEPSGGSRPTDGWRAGEQIADNYALPIPLGTPPGEYRLVAAVYDAQTGQRLTHARGDVVELGSVLVQRSPATVAADLIPMTRAERRLGPVTLLGYDAYRKDFAHAPATPLRPGDKAHFVLYWQAPDPLPADWPAELSLTLKLGEQAVTAPLGGESYPTGAWQPGEIVRMQVDVPYDGMGARPVLEVAGESSQLDGLPH